MCEQKSELCVYHLRTLLNFIIVMIFWTCGVQFFIPVFFFPITISSSIETGISEWFLTAKVKLFFFFCHCLHDLSFCLSRHTPKQNIWNQKNETENAHCDCYLTTTTQSNCCLSYIVHSLSKKIPTYSSHFGIIL